MKHRDFGKGGSGRRQWQNPEAILAEIGLRNDMAFVDVGCGRGFFAIPAARIVGEEGTVYGVDVDATAISFLKKEASKQGLTNMILKTGKAEDTIFCESCADIVFFGIDLHDFDDPDKVLWNAKKMLKPSGKLVDLDWKKEPMDLGPPLQIRFSEDEAARRIENAGFKIEAKGSFGRYNYLIVARP